jgi:hypothetical protein
MSTPKPRPSPVDGYVTVAERIEQFYEKYPDGRINTFIQEHDPERGFILFRAEIFRHPDDAQPAASGHAYEYRDGGYVQKTSYIEVCETSAVGRALALCGFEVKRGIASREEMDKQQRHPTGQSRPPASNAGQSRPSASKVTPIKQEETGRNWHQEISALWKQLRALGIADFKDGEAMMAHFKATAKKKQWNESLQELERISNAPTPTARAYVGILTDIYEDHKQRFLDSE